MTQPIRSVLVVDDDDSIREVAKVALEMIGSWRVSTARSGAEALRLARDLQPDLMLLDVMMPTVDGPATVAQLRRDPVVGDLPVVFLTAVEPAGDGWSDLGVIGVIAKPFDPLTLSADLSRMLGWEE